MDIQTPTNFSSFHTGLVFGGQKLVDFVDNPAKESPVQGLAHSISGIWNPFHIELLLVLMVLNYQMQLNIIWLNSKSLALKLFLSV